MRDPLTWSFPLGRLFGVHIKVHFLFPVVVLGLVLRVAFTKDVAPGLWVEALFLMGLLFVAVLLHEFGHVFGARWADGDASEVLLWPLGGLAAVEVPHTPRANFVSTAAGPFVNLVLAVGVVTGLAAFALTPSFNPFASPYTATLYNWANGAYYGSVTGRAADLYEFTAYKFKDGSGWLTTPAGIDDADPRDPKTGKELVAVRNLHPDRIEVRAEPGKPWEERLVYAEEKDKKVPVLARKVPHGAWLVVLSRFFWVNWVLLLLNLLPAFPLDGGRLLQAVWWARTDYRAGTLAAIFGGFLMMFVVILYAFVAAEQVMPLLLALFIYVSCRRQWIILETGGEESPFGYDFSQGYTSLERDEGAPPPRRPSWWQRWKQKRAQEKMRREQEQRAAEERRLDELLEKVQRVGREGLTDEELRFLTRVSAKYRNNRQ